MDSSRKMDTSASVLEKVWMDNVLEILTVEQPHLRASALRVLFILETHKISHPYWKLLYRYFKKAWTRMQESMDVILLNLDANRSFIEEDITHAEEDFDNLLIRAKRTMKLSVFRVWNALRLRVPPTWVKEEYHNFMHKWVVMESLLESMIYPQIPKEEDMRFCCELKCFLLPNEGVDGQACEECRSFGNCHCDCVMYMKYMHDTHCCPLFCTKPELGICLLCPGACLCKCVTHQRVMLQKDCIETTRINGQVLEVDEYQEGTYCCEKKCFPIPVRLFRGLTCKLCNAVNVCKCECVTWKNRNRSPRYECLKKPTAGWQAASEKDLVEFQQEKSFKERLHDHYFSPSKE